jgi:ribonuclease BN (tRNA processing enzyme)
LPPGGLALLDRLGQAFDFEGDASTFFSVVFDLYEYDPDARLETGNLTLTFASTVHWVPCWAIRVHPEDDTGDLFYSADTGPDADLDELAGGARVVIAEATTPIEEKKDGFRGHLAIDEAAALAARAQADTFVATHMFEENDPAATVEVARRFFPGEIVLARPGTIVTWP